MIQWLHVWQVRSKDDNSLTAEHLTSIPAYFGDAGLGILSLKGHLLTQALNIRAGLTWIEVYWWRECSSTSIQRTVFPVVDVPVRESI